MDTTAEQVRWFWSTVDKEIYESLSDVQRDAVSKAASARFAEAIHSDVRLSLGGFFVSIRAGRERRDARRLREERKKYPVFLVRNLPVILVVWGTLLFTLYSLVTFGLRGIATFG